MLYLASLQFQNVSPKYKLCDQCEHFIQEVITFGFYTVLSQASTHTPILTVVVLGNCIPCKILA